MSQKQFEFYKTNENKTWCVNICFFHMLYPLSLLPFSCSDFEQKDILFHLQSALWVVDITADDFLGFCTQEHIYQHGSNSEWLWCCGVPPPPWFLQMCSCEPHIEPRGVGYTLQNLWQPLILPLKGRWHKHISGLSLAFHACWLFTTEQQGFLAAEGAIFENLI